MSEQPTLADGDVITIAGLYADGTCERNDTPVTAYANKPLQKFRCAETVDVEGIRTTRLIPLHDDETVDVFNASVGSFVIRAAP